MSPEKAEKGLRILVANGVNLDLLGIREPEIYGYETLADIEETLRRFADRFFVGMGLPKCEITFFQTNSEADYLNELARGWDGVLLNPGAWTHTSVALADRLAALKLLFVEVHLSNLSKREPFRKQSYTAPFAAGVVYGMGEDGYLAAFVGLLKKLGFNLLGHS